MECNRDDAIRSKEIAERKFMENDIAGAKKFALKAKALFKVLGGIDQMILTLDVYLRAQINICGDNDWYGILEVSPLADEETIKKQYRNLALQIHPDKNSSIGADGAFKLISDAWSVLSDRTKRIAHDQKRYISGFGVHQNNFQAKANSTSNFNMSSMNGLWHQNYGVAPPTNVLPSDLSKQDTFWTYCGSCGMSFQYTREHVNQHLKCPVCQAVFVAVEVPPPSTPIYPNESKPTATKNKIGGTAVPAKATPGLQAGMACGSQNYDPMLWQWSFPTSATGAQTTRYNNVRKECVAEANVARSEEANLRRKVMETIRKPARAGASPGSLIAATKESEAAKRRCANGDKKTAKHSTSTCPDGDSGLPMHTAKRKPGSMTGTSGAKRRKVLFAVPNCESSGNAGKLDLGKVLMLLDVRGILMKKTQLQLRDKVEELNSKKANLGNKEKMPTSKKSSTKIASSTAVDVEDIERKQSSKTVHPEEKNGTELDGKRVDSEEKEKAQSSKPVGLEEQKSWNWRFPEVHIVYTRNCKKHKKEPGLDAAGANSAKPHCLDNKDTCLNQESSSDEGSGEMPVPDADFYKFGDHSENSFQNDQIWAVYDEEDGMPRYYALIRKVISIQPFKVKLAYLKAKDCNEFGTSEWISFGYSKTCGDFRVGVSKDTDQLNTFSHVVTWEKGPGGIIRIFPKKGDIWALYQNWSPDWNELTPDDTMYKYELVEVLDSYNPSEGISVMPIVKVPGFVAVFKSLLDPTKSRRIPKEEMLRFSHQVPFHVLTGEEAENSPKGCYELDPASTPQELLQVVPQSDDAK